MVTDQCSSQQRQIVDEAEAALRLGVKRQTLANWRATQRQCLPYVKVGRLVRYRVSDLDGFIASRLVVGTRKQEVAA